MNRKSWIAWMSVIAAVGCSVVAPDFSSAHSTLLSGYGGPGAGEQTIIGSTLLSGPRGSSGSGSGGKGAGSSSEPSVQSLAVPTASSSGRSGAAAASGTGTAAATGSGASVSVSGTSAPEAARPGNGQVAARRSAGTPAATAEKPYAYPSALRSTAASHPLGLSSGDLLLMGAIVAALGALGALTIRVARLQR